MLEVKGLVASYGVSPVLFGVSFSLRKGERLALIGSNGAGKSTTFGCLAGLLKPSGGEILLGNSDIVNCSADQILGKGLALVPEGRKLFPTLTVEENLRVGAHLRRQGAWSKERVYETFASLYPLRNRLGNQLSGGQQQLVAVGRALMSNPSVLLCDEVSLGLSPAAVSVVYDGLEAVRNDGMSIILVEQDIGRALAQSDRFICMRYGKIVLEGQSSTANRAEISDAYFGVDIHV